MGWNGLGRIRRFGLVGGGLSFQVVFQGFRRLMWLSALSLSLSLLFVDQDVISQLFLCFVIMDSNPLKTVSQIKCFLWCIALIMVFYHIKRKVATLVVHMVDLVSAFIGFSASVSTMAAVPVCSPTKSGVKFSFPHIITRIWCQLYIGSQPQLVYPQIQLLYIRLREHPEWGTRKIIRATGPRWLVSEYLLDMTVMLSPQNLSIVATCTRPAWRHPHLTWWRKPLRGLTLGEELQATDVAERGRNHFLQKEGYSSVSGHPK